jgi:ATP-dependent protease ClpP protease subunit
MPKMFRKTPGVFTMAAKQDKTAEILIYDVIGEDWYGGISGKAFVEQLASLGDVDSITVRINSPGGDVFEGVAIYNALKTHPATINVQIDSLAASIATVIAMAGDTITISDTGMMMVHNASGVCFGEASDMRNLADLLDKIRDVQMIGAYSRTGMTPDQLKAIMDAETWYSPQEAIDAGWADAITAVPAQSPEARARFDLSAFRHPPKAMQEPTEVIKEVVALPETKELPDISEEIQQKALIAARIRNENLRLAENS